MPVRPPGPKASAPRSRCCGPSGSATACAPSKTPQSWRCSRSGASRSRSVPTSNRLTGAAPANAAHPLGALDAAGCVVTIDADDPALFGTTLLDEYRFVAETFGEDALVRFARNAIDASFAAPAAKARLHAMFERSRNSAPAGRIS